MEAPKSLLTYHIGQLIEVFFNRYFGGTALKYKGQESLSNAHTTQKYVLIKETEEERIQNGLDVIKTGIDFIMESDKARALSRQIAGFNVTVPALSGDAEKDRQTVEKALDEQHAAMKPLLSKTMRTICEVLKSANHS